MNNHAAIGYAIMALKQLGYKKDDIDRVEAVMRNLMDEKSETQAEEAYNEN